MVLPAAAMLAIQAAPGIISAITGNRTTKAEKQQQRLLQQQQDLINAAYNPDSSIYKQQLGIETGNIARDYAGAIEELTRNQRRNNNMGRTGLLDNERADEVLSRLANQGYVQANQQGRTNARNSILGYANSMGGAAGQYANMIEPQAERIKNRSSILSSLGQLGVDIYGASQNPSAGQTIANIYRDTNSGFGGQNFANQGYNQNTQLAVPRLNVGGWVA
jgi:hypothetical protein